MDLLVKIYRFFGLRKGVGGESSCHGPAALRGWDYPIGALKKPSVV